MIDRGRGWTTVSRRRLLLIAGGGVAAAGLTPTGAFSSVSGDRETTVGVVGDTNAYVGLYVYDQVEKNTRDPLVDVTNNVSEDLTITISLVDCTQGTVYAPSGASGCSVSSTVTPGDTKTWEIESNVGNSTTIDFDVSGTGATVEFSARRSTTGVNNATTAVNVKKFKLDNPGVDSTNDQFNVQDIRILDDDGDDDIVRRQFTVTDSNGNSVSLNDSADDPDITFTATGDYTESNITLQADENLQSGETYTITLTGYDADGNRDSASKSADDSPGGGP